MYNVFFRLRLYVYFFKYMPKIIRCYILRLYLKNKMFTQTYENSYTLYVNLKIEYVFLLKINESYCIKISTRRF